jgi:hypothetical protein
MELYKTYAEHHAKLGKLLKVVSQQVEVYKGLLQPTGVLSKTRQFISTRLPSSNRFTSWLPRRVMNAKGGKYKRKTKKI